MPTAASFWGASMFMNGAIRRRGAASIVVAERRANTRVRPKADQPAR